MTTRMHSALVVGASLECACELAWAGVQVIVRKKSRRAGGRIATRALQRIALNHSAQFATARAGQFIGLCLSEP
ncbi:MAG TPA: hypothetical protein VF523_07340 [Burkholderiales bacterium]